MTSIYRTEEDDADEFTTVRMHIFPSSSDAYNCSQCYEEIKNGDVLWIPEEKVVGILVEAWPVAVSEAKGAFHEIDSRVKDWDWSKVGSVSLGKPDYNMSEAFKIASAIKRSMEQ